MGRAQPVLGYPSKSAAASALANKGLRHFEIAAKIGCKPGNVGALIGSYQRSPKHAERAVAATPGRWTPEKKIKAIRLYPKIVELVAAELQVPPAELLRLWVKGETPQMVEPSRVELVRAKDPVRQTARRNRPKKARPAKEAKIATSGAGKVLRGRLDPSLSENPARQSVERVARWFRLRGAGGVFLHFSGTGTTRDRAIAWIGTRAQAKAMRRASPDAALMRLVVEPKWQPRDGHQAAMMR
jgi:transposase-like protein